MEFLVKTNMTFIFPHLKAVCLSLDGFPTLLNMGKYIFLKYLETCILPPSLFYLYTVSLYSTLLHPAVTMPNSTKLRDITEFPFLSFDRYVRDAYYRACPAGLVANGCCAVRR